MPNVGDELHHYGWNACSSCLCPNAPHPHTERRYLVVPGLRSSRIYIIDTKPDPKSPTIVRVIEPEEMIEATGYSRPHTVHCGPDGIYVSALGDAKGDTPGGIFLMDAETFDVLGRWEVDRGPQRLAYDAWWHLGYDTMVTSEWGAPNTIENGLVPEILLGAQYGRRLHFWDLQKRKHLQEIDFGPDYQLVFELRPAHDPTKAYGFVNCVISLKDLSSSIWTWYRDGDKWAVKKVIDIPAEPADPDLLPPVLKGFKAVPPLVTDIDLSMDDRFLYVACWGTGDLRQYDVSDPFDPKLTGKVRIGGIVSRALAPARQRSAQRRPADGRDQPRRTGASISPTRSMARSTRNSIPTGIDGWMVKLDAGADGGIEFDPRFFVTLAEEPPPASSAPARRRLLVGLLLLSVSLNERRRTLAWLVLIGLGAFHGLNPAMGWLFAVALGLYRQSRNVVLVSLIPIALGHAAAIAVVVYAVIVLGMAIDAGQLSHRLRRAPDRVGRLSRHSTGIVTACASGSGPG